MIEPKKSVKLKQLMMPTISITARLPKMKHCNYCSN